MRLRSVLVLVLAGSVVLGACGGAGGDRAPTSEPQPLPPEGRELIDLLTKGLNATYHARYQSTLADPRSTGAQVLMDIWRKGELGRQEVAVQAQGARSRTTTFLLPPQAIECAQVADKQWTCKPPTAAPVPDPPEVQVGKVLALGRIQARDDRIAGLPVRCFTYPPDEEIEETCLLSDGVLARMVTSSSRFDLAALTSTVPDDVFIVPAPG